MLRHNRLDPDRACVFIIDVQEKLVPFIHHHQQVVAATRKLLEGTAVFGLPTLATEQYPKGIGRTVPEIAELLNQVAAPLLEKLTFSSCGEDPVREALRRIDRPQVILAGIEAHVCVQQTALDLRTMDYDVFVCADAVGSRGSVDYENALGRMRQEGVYVTTVESALFELCERCGTPRFKEMIEVIKRHPPAGA